MAGGRAGSLGQGAFYTACREFAHRDESLRIPTGGRHYLAKDAVKKVMKIQKKEFFDNQLADVFLNMELLGISIDEVIERYNKLKNSSS